MKNAADKEEVENFWREICWKEVQHNELCRIKNQYQQNPSMQWSPVCEKDVAEALRTTLIWKAPGRDQIASFLLKHLTDTHKPVAALFNKLIEADQITKWLTAGVIFLIPKNENTENPKNYRTVTCVPTIYKLVTSIICRRMQKYMDDENLIPKEKKCAAVGQKNTKISCYFQKQSYKNVNTRKKICMA